MLINTNGPKSYIHLDFPEIVNAAHFHFALTAHFHGDHTGCLATLQDRVGQVFRGATSEPDAFITAVQHHLTQGCFTSIILVVAMSPSTESLTEGFDKMVSLSGYSISWSGQSK